MLAQRDSTEVEELYSSWTLFIICLLLILSLLTSYYLQIKRIRAVHETVVSIFAGMFVGLVVRLSPGHLIREMLSFSHTLFFNLLLPPIILNSGYEMRQDNFFRNFISILIFAFLGTFISAIGIGILVYLYSLLHLDLTLPLLDALIFGSTLSATDPVTILSIFTQYKVDPKLYSIIFGESLLNDAVSIVMYETLTKFKGQTVGMAAIGEGIGIFFASFSMSMVVGIAIALGTSLLLKHSSLHLYPSLESCLVALLAYASYFLSNGLHLSGIVSLLFNGITLKHYAYHTMSRRTQRTTKYLFSVLAQLSENFIFVYLGLNLFTQEFAVFKPLFILVSTLAVVFTRYLAVFPLSEAINAFHRWRGRKTTVGKGKPEIPHSYQMMLFWAGLRGAVGVALAAGFTGETASALRTAVLVVVVLSVIMFGGTTSRMLEVMQIRTGVQEEDSSSEEEERAWLRSGRLGPPGARWNDSPTQRRTRRWSRSTPFGQEPATIRASHGRSSSVNANNTVVFEGSSSEEGDELPMGGRSYNHHHQTSINPIDSRSFPPIAAPITTNDERGHVASGSSASLRQAGEALFQHLDERYLLPLFSNAVASRTFHAKKARKRATLSQANLARSGESPVEDWEEESWPNSPVPAGQPLGASSSEGRAAGGSSGGRDSPAGDLFDNDPSAAGIRGAVKRKNQEVFRSIGSFWRGPGNAGESARGSPRGGAGQAPLPRTSSLQRLAGAELGNVGPLTPGGREVIDLGDPRPGQP